MNRIMLVFEYDNIMRVIHEEAHDLIIHHWFNYNPPQKDHVILEIFQKIYENLLENGVPKVLVRVYDTKGAFSPEIHKYLNEIQFPRLVKDTKMRFVATVTNKADMSAKYANIWKDQLESNIPVVLRDFDTEAEARTWLDSISTET